MLEGKVIVITGGGSGIGRATAKLFAVDGARVVIADWNADLGVELADELTTAGGEACFVETDVSDDAAVAAMVDFAVARYGRLDGAFNNAGVEFHGKIVPDLAADEWRKVIDINLTGVFLCMKHEIAAMRQTGGGAIVNAGRQQRWRRRPTRLNILRRRLAWSA